MDPLVSSSDLSCTEGLKESPLPILNMVLRDRFCWNSKDSRSFQIVGAGRSSEDRTA